MMGFAIKPGMSPAKTMLVNILKEIDEIEKRDYSWFGSGCSFDNWLVSVC